MRQTPISVLAAGLALGALIPCAGALAASQGGTSVSPRAGGQTQLILSHGRATARLNRFLPAPDTPPIADSDTPASTAPARRAASGRLARVATAPAGPTVSAALLSLEQTGAISPAQHQLYLGIYEAAGHSVPKLKGTRHTEMAAVIANVASIASSGGFIPSRLPALFLTLERNRQWWTTGPLLSADERVGFPGDRLVWEYYPGQGIEIQWLATFGEANGYYLNGHQNGALRQLMTEVIPLATQRAGGIAWEYLFRFDGGVPPWTSGLSQGTALQALARAWSRLHDQADLTAAQQALGIFEYPPPVGVRVATPAGAHYLEYSFAPQERILNGFIQALVGLYDYTSLTHDLLGEQMFEAGDAEARAEVPKYDTGAWSLYDQSSESDLSYHELLTQFLQNLCQRTSVSVTPIPGAAGGTTGPTGPSGPTGPTGGAPPSATPDAIYCTTAQHFQAYLVTKPQISLLSSRLQDATSTKLTMSLSKISDVTVTVRNGSKVMLSTTRLLAHGNPQVVWTAPKPGTDTVTVTAVDLAGNRSTATGTVTVLPAPHSSKKHTPAPSKPAPPKPGSGQPSPGAVGGTSPGG